MTNAQLHAFSDGFTFPLRDGAEHRQHQASHRTAGVELFHDRHQRDFVQIESGHHVEQITQIARQSIESPHDERLHLSGFDTFQNARNAGTIQIFR